MLTIVITAVISLIIGVVIGGYVVHEHQQEAIEEWESDNQKH